MHHPGNRTSLTGPVHLVVDHPAERARVALPADTKAELRRDLCG